MDENGIPLEHLTDRELLILAVRDLQVQGKRINSHADRIKALELWRAAIVGIGGFLAVALGLKHGK